MLLVNNISNFANQTVTLLLDDSTSATMNLIFNATTERWVMGVTYVPKSFENNCIGICTYPNLLHQWKDILPFGLQVVTNDMTDPFTVNDFFSGRAKMYLLNAADVLEVEALLFAQ